MSHRGELGAGRHTSSQLGDVAASVDTTPTRGWPMSTETPTEMPAMRDAMPLVLTVPEAAELLGMTRRSCYRAVEADAIPTMRVGRRIMIPTARLLTQLGLPLDHIAWGGPPTSPARGPGR